MPFLVIFAPEFPEISSERFLPLLKMLTLIDAVNDDGFWGPETLEIWRFLTKVGGWTNAVTVFFPKMCEFFVVIKKWGF